MGVSKNNGTPKSSIFSIGFSMKQKTIQFLGAFFSNVWNHHVIQIFFRPKTRGNSVAEAFGVAFFFVSFIIAMLTCLTALALWNGLSSWRFWSPESFGENVEISSVFPATLPGFCTIPTVGRPSNF